MTFIFTFWLGFKGHNAEQCYDLYVYMYMLKVSEHVVNAKDLQRPTIPAGHPGVLCFVSTCMSVCMLCLGGGVGGCLCDWVGFLSSFLCSFYTLSAGVLYTCKLPPNLKYC